METSYEIDDILELVKKRYCPYCGNKLRKKMVDSYIAKKGTSEHASWSSSGGKHWFHGDILVKTLAYHCQQCNRDISMEQQRIYTKMQKKANRKILQEQELQEASK